MGIRHNYVSSKADKADDSLVRPSDWNDDHVIELYLYETSQNYTALTTDEVILANTNISNITVTLPNLQDVDNRIYHIKKISVLNSLDIVGGSGEKVDKQTCYTLGAGTLNSIRMVADYANSTWWVI